MTKYIKPELSVIDMETSCVMSTSGLSNGDKLGSYGDSDDALISRRRSRSSYEEAE